MSGRSRFEATPGALVRLRATEAASTASTMLMRAAEPVPTRHARTTLTSPLIDTGYREASWFDVAGQAYPGSVIPEGSFAAREGIANSPLR